MTITLGVFILYMSVVITLLYLCTQELKRIADTLEQRNDMLAKALEEHRDAIDGVDHDEPTR